MRNWSTEPFETTTEMIGTGAAQPWTDDLRGRLDDLLDEHRAMLQDSLDGLTEEAVRRSLVPSRTTLLGLVKHVTYVENVWFNQALTGRSLQELGGPSTPDRSFVLRTTDTIASVRAAYTAAVRNRGASLRTLLSSRR